MQASMEEDLSLENLVPNPGLSLDLIHLLIDNFSVPVACFSHPPSALQLLRQQNLVDLAIIGMATFLTLVSVVIFVEDAVYLSKKIRCFSKMKTLIWSSSAPTAVSVFSLLGLWVPRAMTYVEMAIGAYFAVCFYLTMLVMVEGFGGTKAVVKALKDTPMLIRTGPCCCCCPCCPPITMTKRKLRVMLLGAFQYAFLKVSCTFLGLVLSTEGLYDTADISATSVALWINTALGVSTLLALWSLAILFRQAKTHLAEQNMTGKFVCFQVLLILTALQPSIFSVLASGGQIACTPPFSSRARGQQMHAQLLILEIFVLAVLARMYYRKPDDKPGCCLSESPDYKAGIKQ
ncbi:organic solute transporter subunit alpha isoform X1 [Thamnophis elegans]|uniref:organic solute transporter subunit alpha isoform X1 n=2 Tax=Thamnophis elegans TaxID=35005 RepID=UPI001377DD46|nr:organic solute transporter subunit alpha isoform X1 [Thamnophis elegans]